MVAATAFVIGGSLFCVGALLAQAHIGGQRLAAAVFLAGGVFFTTGGYSSVLLVANERGGKWRWWSTEQTRLEWASAVALFVGTLYFGGSLLAAPNWSTFAGAACFAAAGVMQEFQRP